MSAVELKGRRIDDATREYMKRTTAMGITEMWNIDDNMFEKKKLEYMSR